MLWLIASFESLNKDINIGFVLYSKANNHNATDDNYNKDSYKGINNRINEFKYNM